MSIWDRLAAAFAPSTGALILPRPGDVEAFADAAYRAAEAEIQRRATNRQSFADANWQWQTGAIGNPNTGLLQSQDDLVGTIPQPYLFLTDYYLAQLIADASARRICSAHADSIASAGYTVTVPEGDDFLPVDDALTAALGNAHTKANQLRAGGVFIDFEEDGDPPLSEPVDPRRVRGIRRMVVYDGLQMIVTKWQTGNDWVSPLWAPYQSLPYPELFQINATFRTGAFNGPVHWTRILYMQGVPIPCGADGMVATPSSHFALSLIDLCWAAIRRYTTTTTNAERIGSIQGAWILKVENFAALQSSAQQTGTSGVIGMVSTWISRMLAGFYAKKAMVGPPGFDVSAATVNLSGWDLLEAGSYVQACNAADVPLQRLYMTPPVGLTATPSDQWVPQYTDALEAQFKQKWAANILRYEALRYYLKTGRAPASISVKMKPWRKLTELEQMELRLKGAQELESYVKNGILTAQEARARLSPTYTVDFPVAAKAPEVGTSPALADAADGVWVGLDVDAGTLPQQAALLAPGLRVEPWPHVTLLYLGAVRPGAMADVLAAAAHAAARAPVEVAPVEVGELGAERAQVVFLRRAGLAGVQDGLLRACAPAVQAEQFPRFVPHLTLGYGAPVEGLTLPEALPVRALCVRRGEVEIARYAVE